MKKVLFLIDTLEVGGAETSILEIASRFKEWEPVVVHIYPGETLKPQFLSAGIKVYSLAISAKFGFWSAYKKIKTIVQTEKPTIIHATLFKAEMLSRFLGPRFGIPVINSFVNDSYTQQRYTMLNFKQKVKLNVYKAADRFTAKRVTKFMSITRAIIGTNTTALKIDPDNVEVIYRGRDIPSLRKKINSEQLKELQGNYGEGPIVLTVSRLLIRKGYLEAIKAMKNVVLKNHDVKYLIAGEGHDRKKIELLIDSLELNDNVFLLGNRRDVPSLLAFSDIFLFPSHFEGQGGALVEAMILGKPIISSRIPVIEESVKDDYSALLFEPHNIEDLTSKILWAVSNPEKMRVFGEQAKKEAELRFDITKVALKHEKMYDQIILNRK